MSHEKLDRNREIYIRYKSGRSYKDLAADYKVTEARIRQIIDQVRRQNLKQSPDIKEIWIACEKFKASEVMNGRIQNALRRIRMNVHYRWLKLKRADILKIRNLGEKAADIIEYAQKIAK